MAATLDEKIWSAVTSAAPLCTPGETKCVGYDLYTCSGEYTWELTEHNSSKCGYEKPFPWLWVGIGGAALIGLGLAIRKRKT